MKARVALSLVVQLYNLRVYHPEGRGELRGARGKQTLYWRQRVKPDPLGAAYEIEIRCGEVGAPDVLVRSPDLRELAGGRKLPHIYTDVDGMVRLCLWADGEWGRSKLIAKTIVIWAAEWFWFFEHWLVTGHWFGGGTHPTPFSPPPGQLNDDLANLSDFI